MVRKPARMYNHLAKTAYCRRQYMGGVPGVKVVQFDMGNLKEDFPVAVHLEAIEGCQIRHTAMEAARINMNRRLMNSVGKNNFHLKRKRLFPAKLRQCDAVFIRKELYFLSV